MSHDERKRGPRRRRPDIHEDPVGLDDVIWRRLQMTGGQNGTTKADVLADTLIDKALGGDLKVMEFLGRRVGQAPEVIDYDYDDEGEDDEPEDGVDDKVARRVLEAAAREPA